MAAPAAKTIAATAFPVLAQQLAMMAAPTISKPLTKIFAISDLHLEFYVGAKPLFDYLKPILPAADVLVLAGDIGYPNSSLKRHAQNYRDLLGMFKNKYKNVILVPGNHEYYKAKNYDRKEVLEDLRDICRSSDVHLLQREKVKINDVMFYGTTLWSAIDSHVVDKMNDFGSAFKNRIDYLEEFIGDYSWLRSELAESKEKKQVVVTHHVPSSRLIHPRFEGNPLNTGFYTNVVNEVNMSYVNLWVAGHTHEMSQARYGDATLYVNPVGYPHEQNARMTEISDKVFEI